MALCVTLLLFLCSYLFRHEMVTRIANHYLKPANTQVQCLTFTLTASLNVKLKHLCLKHSLGKVEIINANIDWSLQPNLTINEIAIATIKVNGMSAIELANESPQPALTPLLFHQYMDNITELSSPLKLNVQSFQYQPFNHPKVTYLGAISANDQGLHFTLTRDTKPIFTLQIKAGGQMFVGQLKTDIAPLRQLLLNHNIAFNEQYNLAGQINSQFNWQDNRFTMQNQLQNLNASDSQFNIEGQLQWLTTLDKHQLTIQFDESSLVQLNTPTANLVALLEQKQASTALLQLLKDNQPQSLLITPPKSISVDFNKQQLTMSTLDIKSSNTNSPIHLQLFDTALPLNMTTFDSKFKLATTLQVAMLKPLTKKPVSINTSGHLSIKPQQLSVNFDQGSEVNLTALKIDTTRLSSMQTDWQGAILIKQGQQPQLNLNTHTQLEQLILPKWANITLTKIDATIKGSENDIKINGQIIADDIPISQFKISGDINQPLITASANELNLIDLWSMNQNKFIEIALVDGTLDYHLSGQLNDFKKVDNNPLDLSLTIKELTGDIDNTWVETLDWQQHITLQNGDISTSANQSNFSLSLVEAGSELTNISATTNFQRIGQAFSLQLDNVKGEAFGGHFAIPSITWPGKVDKPAVLQLQDIDLTKLIELQQQQGIVVTGKISGQLPIYFDDGVTISEGQLYNTNNGIIQVKDNLTVQQLKQSRTELKLAFDALQNLHYHLLTSTVTMTKDGQMLLETAIKGINPDLDNEVNFNLNLDYDLLGLLESARIADTFEQQINQKIQQ